MDIALAVERHRRNLLRIVATMFAMIGLAGGESVQRLSPSVYRAVLRLLRPAESAVRRLIVVAARNVVLKLPGPRSSAEVRKAPVAVRKPSCRVTFRLFDPNRRFTSAFAFERPRGRIKVTPVKRLEPRIHVIGFDPRIALFHQPPPVVHEPPPAPMPDGLVSASRLCRRLAAIKSALEDLPRQARRYAHWQARPLERRRPLRDSALRSGTPPGHRRRPVHPVDEILAECHWLARHPPSVLDTS